FAVGRLSQLRPWQQIQEQKRSRKEKRLSVKAIQMPPETLKLRRGEADDPAEIADANEQAEIAWRRLMEGATDSQRARANAMSEDERSAELRRLMAEQTEDDDSNRVV